jgi:hypothetical protein
VPVSGLAAAFLLYEYIEKREVLYIMHMPQIPDSTGLTSSQLEQLCQPEQLERTLHLLFYMNHWAKARERLFFADRQGLYQVKAAVLRRAYAVGAIEAVAYINGTQGFGKDITLDIAADIAAEVLIERLAGLSDPDPYMSDIHEKYNHMACQFYTRMTGKEVASPSDIGTLDIQQVREYIYARLQELKQQARATCRAIPYSELKALCVAPTDLLYIQDRRFYYLDTWDSWDSLDASDLRKLDPEGLSLIAFRYTSPITYYVFHLPFRQAEALLSAQRVYKLKHTPATSREFGVYYGRPITEPESLEHPIEEILQELGVDIAAICPRQLSNKQEYTLAQATRYAQWSEEWDYNDEDEELDEDVWNDVFTPAKKKQSLQMPTHREREHCPLCYTGINTPGISRIDHWRQAHPGQDLTISQASWLLNSSTTKEQFCADIPPDYRIAIEGVKGKGTRYWKLETLEARTKEHSVEEEKR